MERTEAQGCHTPASSFAALRNAANDLLPLVEAEAEEAERLYRQTDRLVAEFRRTGLYALLTPSALGGAELAFVEAMEIVELVSRADGSAGWCLMVQGVQATSAGAFLPDPGARTVYPNGADVTMAGQGPPRGSAQPVDGGFLTKGHWGYASGIYHAEWIHSGCFVMDGAKIKLDQDGFPVSIFAHHPKDTIELKGNWNAHGLRGTGSYDYTIKGEDVFVPADQCFPGENAIQIRGGPQYGSGTVGATMWGHTGWALGVGRRALDELAKIARKRSDAYGKMHDSASFRQSFAEAEVKYRAARSFVYSTWDSLSESFAKGDQGSLEQIALIRLAMRHIHDVISEISTYAHRAARGVSLRDSVLQRCYRDIHSGTQHLLLADEVVQDCGKVLLGVTGEKAEWTVLGLKDI